MLGAERGYRRAAWGASGVGDIAFAHVVTVAIGLAEEDGLVDFAAGGGHEARATYMSTV